MNHHMSKKGYVFLMFFLYAGMSLVFNIASAIFGRIGFDIPPMAIFAIKGIIAFTATFIVAGRFLSIEKRVATGSETSSIALWSFLLITLGLLLALPLSMGPQQGVPDSQKMEGIANAFTVLTIVSVSIFVFSYLNFGVFAKARSVEKTLS